MLRPMSGWFWRDIRNKENSSITPNEAEDHRAVHSTQHGATGSEAGDYSRSGWEYYHWRSIANGLHSEEL